MSAIQSSDVIGKIEDGSDITQEVDVLVTHNWVTCFLKIYFTITT